MFPQVFLIICLFLFLFSKASLSAELCGMRPNDADGRNPVARSSVMQNRHQDDRELPWSLFQQLNSLTAFSVAPTLRSGRIAARHGDDCPGQARRPC
jgi:hypothetical protein